MAACSDAAGSDNQNGNHENATCGNGVVEAGERCDGDCPTSCSDGDVCTEDVFSGSPSTCDAVCANHVIAECRDGDECCPSGCNALNDDACQAVCGNGSTEPGELCDGDCPADSDSCTTDILEGAASSCDVVCSNEPINSCLDADGCCPTGCLATDDDDCAAHCGNSVVEPGETCDGNCPSSCDDGDPCTTDAMSGSASTCDVICHNTVIAVCLSGDGCCPTGCNTLSDGDCLPGCGNGVVESGETCDGNCPDCIDVDVCTTDTFTGSPTTCDVVCQNQPIVTCQHGDGCCPGGCSLGTDSDCPAVCGNGITEPGETCDGNCPTTCDDGQSCTQDTQTGRAWDCDVVCSSVLTSWHTEIVDNAPDVGDHSSLALGQRQLLFTGNDN